MRSPCSLVASSHYLVASSFAPMSNPHSLASCSLYMATLPLALASDPSNLAISSFSLLTSLSTSMSEALSLVALLLLGRVTSAPPPHPQSQLTPCQARQSHFPTRTHLSSARRLQFGDLRPVSSPLLGHP